MPTTSFSYRPKVPGLILATVVGLVALVLVPWLAFTEAGRAWWFGIIVAVVGLMLLIGVWQRRPGGTHLELDGSVLTVRGGKRVSVDLAQMAAVGPCRADPRYLAAEPGASGPGDVANWGTNLYPILKSDWGLVRLIDPSTWDRPAEDVVAAIRAASGERWREDGVARTI